MTVLKYLDLSSAHLPENERSALLAGDLLDNDWPRVINHTYGWWVNVPSDAEVYDFADQAPALAQIIDHARCLDCTWVNIDSDAAPIDALTVYE
ncbi:MAG: hypothetical protein WKF94_16355 [Solirubrobacteraceae bacterium]